MELKGQAKRCELRPSCRIAAGEGAVSNVDGASFYGENEK
jgi:hypothetical protein